MGMMLCIVADYAEPTLALGTRKKAGANPVGQAQRAGAAAGWLGLPFGRVEFKKARATPPKLVANALRNGRWLFQCRTRPRCKLVPVNPGFDDIREIVRVDMVRGQENSTKPRLDDGELTRSKR